MKSEKLIEELQRRRDKWLEYQKACKQKFESSTSPKRISEGFEDANAARCAGVVMGLNIAIEAIERYDAE